jgi:hypothetical protein
MTPGLTMPLGPGAMSRAHYTHESSVECSGRSPTAYERFDSRLRVRQYKATTG